MKKYLSCCTVVVSLLVALSTASQAQADVKLPKVIASHMVLQRDRALPIWGWADPGEEVTVKLDSATASGCTRNWTCRSD
jgi:sialate O-acetylesterase